jgi:nitrous oxidase accessory protein NosD
MVSVLGLPTVITYYAKETRLKIFVGTGSLHFEWCSNVKANNNSIYDSQYGIVFQAGNDHVFENNSVYRCDYGFFCMYNGVDTQSFAKLLNNYLDGLKQYGILVQNAKYIDVIEIPLLTNRSTQHGYYFFSRNKR